MVDRTEAKVVGRSVHSFIHSFMIIILLIISFRGEFIDMKTHEFFGDISERT